MSRTPLLIKPTLEEVYLQGDKIGLPRVQSKLFFLYYESNGWKVGKVPMKNWLAALQGWKLRFDERREKIKQEINQGSANDVSRELKKWRER